MWNKRHRGGRTRDNTESGGRGHAIPFLYLARFPNSHVSFVNETKSVTSLDALYYCRPHIQIWLASHYLSNTKEAAGKEAAAAASGNPLFRALWKSRSPICFTFATLVFHFCVPCSNDFEMIFNVFQWLSALLSQFFYLSFQWFATRFSNCVQAFKLFVIRLFDCFLLVYLFVFLTRATVRTQRYWPVRILLWFREWWILHQRHNWIWVSVRLLRSLRFPAQRFRHWLRR